MYYLDADELNLSHGGTQCIDLCVSPAQRVLTHTGQPKKQRGWKVLDRQSDKAISDSDVFLPTYELIKRTQENNTTSSAGYFR